MAGASGRTKLLGGRFGAEIGWLYPLALLALAYGLVRWRRAPCTDPVRGGFVLWGVWLLTFGLIFSAMGTIPHTAYIAALAPALAALGGAGIVLLWRAYRTGRRAAWLLPAAVLAAPAIWSASALDVRYAGTSYDAGAGPAGLGQGLACGPGRPMSDSISCSPAPKLFGGSG